MDGSPETRGFERRSLARSIAAGGIGIVAFGAALALAWYSAATLFMLFAGILFGVFLTAMADLLRRVFGGNQTLRLVIVCLLFTGLLSGVVVLGGATIAQQATALSSTLRAQLGNAKDFLEKQGIDTSFLNVGTKAAPTDAGVTPTPNTSASPSRGPKLPDASTIASGTGAIITQTIKILTHVFEGVGNFFIIIFLGLLLAVQPKLYRDGILRFVPRQRLPEATRLIDDVSETLRRWLLGQMATMATLFLLTWIGLTVIGIPGALVLGFVTGLLTFIPNVGAILAGALIVLASLGSGFTAIISSFALYLAVQFLEGNVLTPLIQRHAISIPPATLFAAQIFLGVLFGVWGLALALPLIAVIKVVLNHVWPDQTAAAQS
ncbi:AI-2E family transporter [Nitrobacter sp. TKz-YC02]|uniref:AI-2E family transporter n=1 Tax=Nitrobacter sp. TKz-YC02 TaxID=3398704 RepID=UPI003CFB8CD6